MKSVAAIIILLSLPFSVVAWVQNSRVSNSRAFVVKKHSTTKLLVANGADFSKDNEMTDKPCWQDIWSYDCAMSTAYSASFVPAEWIRKLPCALGLADCDTPETLKRPAPADGSGVENVDVMDFLQIKRAESIVNNDDEE